MSPRFLPLPLCLLAAVPGPAGAASTLLSARPDSALAETIRSLEGTPLRLEDAVTMALQEATDVRSARAAMKAAHGALRRERGAFDPELFADATRRGDDLPNNSAFDPTSVVVHNRTDQATGGARITFPTGTEITASLVTSKFETDGFTTLRPQYQTAGVLELRQPLLRGFGPGTWGEWKGTQRDFEAARARYEDAALAMRTLVAQSYWDLYAAVRDYGVEKVIRDGAEALLREAELRARAGLVGPGQVANARVFLAEQEQALLDREEQLDGVSDQLATLMGRRPGDGRVRYLAVDDPPSTAPSDSLGALLQQAVERNRSLLAARRDVEAARVRARGARWNMLPQLDLIGSLGGNGLAGQRDSVSFGSFTTIVDPSLEGGFSDTWSDVWKRRYPTWSAGLRLTVPIGFRAGAGEHERLRGELEAAEQSYTAAYRALADQVRAAYRDLTNSRKRIEAARMGADASLDQVRIGLLEFRAGRTSAFELVRLAGDVATAQQRYSAALVRTAKAAAELRRLTTGGSAGAGD
ncbi:MAG TPA: TolC family protein [Candidatus Eisenbacteria bacterium]|jgi:outer membrane protein TolC